MLYPPTNTTAHPPFHQRVRRRPPRWLKDSFAGDRNNMVPVVNGAEQDAMRRFLALNELGARLRSQPPNVNPADRSFLLTADAFRASARQVEAERGVRAAGLTEPYPPCLL